MIKFLRKIRQKLIAENKLSKYLLYAIGEIILVVVGILIALNINNNNLKRQQEAKVVSLLETILSDLHTDIKNATEVLAFETIQDSILRQIIIGKATEESYRNIDYIVYFSSFFNFEISDNGYNNLAQSVNEIPEQYQEAYDALSILHSEHKPALSRLDEKIIDFIIEQEKKWATNNKWYSHYSIMIFEDRYSPIPEMVDYLFEQSFS